MIEEKYSVLGSDAFDLQMLCESDEVGLARISAHCDSLRNTIDIGAESAIEQIFKTKASLLRQVDQYETDCKDGYTQRRQTSILSCQQIIAQIRKFQSEFDSNARIIENALEQIDSLRRELDRELEKARSIVFNEQMLTFIPKYSKDLLGNLILSKRF